MTDTDDDRVWTGFLDQNRFDSYQISTLPQKLGQQLEEAHESCSLALSIGPESA